MGSFSLQPLANGRYYAMSIGVNGDGKSSTVSVTPSLDFPTRAIGTVSNAKKAVVTNVGLVKLAVSKVEITGDFAINKNTCTKAILPGGTCNVSVTFSPTQSGPRTGTLKVYDDAIDSPQTVTLTGVGK